MNVTLEPVDIEQITAFVEGLGSVLTLKPQPGDGSPEIAWGDRFFYVAPDGVVPRTQPLASIVTKDYPDDAGSRLDRPGAFRLNIGAGREEFVACTGHEPREPAGEDVDHSRPDVLFAHPVYGYLGWLAVVNPGPRTDAAVRELLRTAHGRGQERYRRRADAGPH
jgi:Family of unknown function (DUF6194)